MKIAYVHLHSFEQFVKSDRPMSDKKMKWNSSLKKIMKFVYWIMFPMSFVINEY